MTEALSWLWPSLLALVTTVLLVLPLRAWLIGRRLVDLPGERRSHDQPTPRGGGLAVVVAVALVLVLISPHTWWPGLIVMLVLAALGWSDDRSELSASLRLAVQFVAAALGLWLLGGIVNVELLGRAFQWPWLWTPLAAMAVVWLVNLHNFMDGSDGLAAMQGVWSCAVLGMALLCGGQVGPGGFGLVLAGGFAGFLVWNRPPARIFMGDVGSLALGGGVGLLALAGAATGAVSIWFSLIVTAVFVVDATATLAMRVVHGKRWYTAHRQHAYQRLIVAGWSHGRVLGLYAATNLIVVAPAAWLAIRYPVVDVVIALGVVILLAGAWWVIQSATRTEKQGHE
ncbi:glycosyl transferase [Wenzhouxiangella sp. AB-CW3]|uniref:glycosyl transferase n=1 Tax=Wenzhouxiangella sp. AB-CW3 TaxID=2771012 RepID=UPI00168B081E|nr:glycosyl transferase [Wenzhouxiangella sp. AB-CW3]QOC21648.1 glycosyl transferase [Wenzhouxiangella sp. AB-CW3]